jgi:uncharacterized protein YuzE
MSAEVNINYDKKNDILYVSFGYPRPSFCVTQVDDVFIMKDIETGEYSGITVMDFKERLNDGSIATLQLPFKLDIKRIAEGLFSSFAC